MNWIWFETEWYSLSPYSEEYKRLCLYSYTVPDPSRPDLGPIPIPGPGPGQIPIPFPVPDIFPRPGPGPGFPDGPRDPKPVPPTSVDLPSITIRPGTAHKHT